MGQGATEKATTGSVEAFCGTWALLPEKSWYQFGAPAQQAKYRIKQEGKQLEIGVEWTEMDGQTFRATNYFIPDGQQYPYDNPDIADAVSASFTGERTLETTSFKNGEVLLFARRELSEDGRHMTITQSGRTPKGTTFSNISIYKKHQE